VVEGGKVVNQRSIFDPYDDYSGYGLTLDVRGKKTSEIVGKIEHDYAIHPLRYGIELDCNDSGIVKFEMTNKGRLSFSRGPVESIIFIIGRYVNFLRSGDENYEFLQSRMKEDDGVTIRETREMLSFKMPSLDKITASREERSQAIMNMLTKDSGANGYIGMPLGSDRINVLDLQDHKIIQITIVDDEILIFSENPSQVRSIVRRLYSKMATRIDPDIKIEKISIGEN
jgi:hypothetical protein